jgi:hypothetical protein
MFLNKYSSSNVLIGISDIVSIANPLGNLASRMDVKLHVPSTDSSNVVVADPVPELV